MRAAVSGRCRQSRGCCCVMHWMPPRRSNSGRASTVTTRRPGQASPIVTVRPGVIKDSNNSRHTSIAEQQGAGVEPERGADLERDGLLARRVHDPADWDSARRHGGFKDSSQRAEDIWAAASAVAGGRVAARNCRAYTDGAPKNGARFDTSNQNVEQR